MYGKFFLSTVYYFTLPWASMTTLLYLKKICQIIKQAVELVESFNTALNLITYISIKDLFTKYIHVTFKNKKWA